MSYKTKLEFSRTHMFLWEALKDNLFCNKFTCYLLASKNNKVNKVSVLGNQRKLGIITERGHVGINQSKEWSLLMSHLWVIFFWDIFHLKFDLDPLSEPWWYPSMINHNHFKCNLMCIANFFLSVVNLNKWQYLLNHRTFHSQFTFIFSFLKSKTISERHLKNSSMRQNFFWNKI